MNLPQGLAHRVVESEAHYTVHSSSDYVFYISEVDKITGETQQDSIVDGHMEPDPFERVDYDPLEEIIEGNDLGEEQLPESDVVLNEINQIFIKNRKVFPKVVEGNWWGELSYQEQKQKEIQPLISHNISEIIKNHNFTIKQSDHDNDEYTVVISAIQAYCEAPKNEYQLPRSSSVYTLKVHIKAETVLLVNAYDPTYLPSPCVMPSPIPILGDSNLFSDDDLPIEYPLPRGDTPQGKTAIKPDIIPENWLDDDGDDE